MQKNKSNSKIWLFICLLLVLLVAGIVLAANSNSGEITQDNYTDFIEIQNESHSEGGYSFHFEYAIEFNVENISKYVLSDLTISFIITGPNIDDIISTKTIDLDGERGSGAELYSDEVVFGFDDYTELFAISADDFKITITSISGHYSPFGRF